MKRRRRRYTAVQFLAKRNTAQANIDELNALMATVDTGYRKHRGLHDGSKYWFTEQETRDAIQADIDATTPLKSNAAVHKSWEIVGTSGSGADSVEVYVLDEMNGKPIKGLSAQGKADLIARFATLPQFAGLTVTLEQVDERGM